MIYSALFDSFYVTDDQLKNSSSTMHGIDQDSETNMRRYGCDLIQEIGILLRLPQVVMATAQVLLHRFYCKQSLAQFDVKHVDPACVWLASKLEESPRRAKQVLIVVNRIMSRKENKLIQNYLHKEHIIEAMKLDLVKTERQILKELGFICVVENPHKLLLSYLVALGIPELTQEAWNVANDSLRTTLCVRFRSNVIACGVVYFIARKFQVPLPENWWEVFDAAKSEVDEVLSVLVDLHQNTSRLALPKAEDTTSKEQSRKRIREANTDHDTNTDVDAKHESSKRTHTAKTWMWPQSW